MMSVVASRHHVISVSVTLRCMSPDRHQYIRMCGFISLRCTQWCLNNTAGQRRTLSLKTWISGVAQLINPTISNREGCCFNTQCVLFWCNGRKRDTTFLSTCPHKLQTHTPPDSWFNTPSVFTWKPLNYNTFSVRSSKGCGSYRGCHKLGFTGTLVCCLPVLLKVEKAFSHFSRTELWTVLLKKIQKNKAFNREWLMYYLVPCQTLV